jgi:DNA-binding NarL/FixJ family response regulator
VATGTVKTHAEVVYRKLGVNGRVQAAVWWATRQGTEGTTPSARELGELGELQSLSVPPLPVLLANSFPSSLTARERGVVSLISEGLSNIEIGERLLINECTVRTHFRHVCGKLGFDHRVQVAVWWATRQGSCSSTN